MIHHIYYTHTHGVCAMYLAHLQSILSSAGDELFLIVSAETETNISVYPKRAGGSKLTNIIY